MKRKCIEDLNSWKEKKGRKPLILRGVRQVGKTYILKKWGKEVFGSVHYLNFEEDPTLADFFSGSLHPSKIIEQVEFYLDTKVDRKSDLLVLDEIQAAPRALTSLKYFSEEMPELAICAAGSLLGLELSSGSFPVGKVDMLELNPLSFKEFLLALGDEKSIPYLNQKEVPKVVHEHLWERLKWYFITGGLPEVVRTFVEFKDSLFEAFREVRKKQEELITGYSSDISKHAGKVNSMHIERLFRAIPEQLAKAQEGSVKRFRFRGVVPGISHYSRLVGAIDWLEAAGLVLKAQIVESASIPLSACAKENTFKLFLFDVGILGALSSLPPKVILNYDYGSYKGYFAENFVAQALHCLGNSPLYSWQRKTAEVEFIQVYNGDLIPLEVKSGSIVRVKSIHLFAEKYHSPFRIILSARPPSKEGVVHYVPLYQIEKYLG